MIITFLNFFKRKSACEHTKITPEMESGYCPDCGEFIENQWFITRCNCCGIKEKATIQNGEIKPESKYCKNCGGELFIVERINKITPFDLYFAVLIKQIVKQRTISYIQTWVDAKEEKINKFLTDKSL